MSEEHSLESDGDESENEESDLHEEESEESAEGFDMNSSWVHRLRVGVYRREYDIGGDKGKGQQYSSGYYCREDFGV